MTHPEFTIDEEGPRTPLLDEQEEEIFEKVSKPGTKTSSPDGEVTPQTNKNNNSVDCCQVQIVASHSDSPLHSLETSVWTSLLPIPAFPVSLFICPISKVMTGVFTIVSAAPKYVWTLICHEEARAQTYEHFNWNLSWGLQRDPVKPQASDEWWICPSDVSVVILKEMTKIILASTPPPVLPNIRTQVTSLLTCGFLPYESMLFRSSAQNSELQTLSNETCWGKNGRYRISL